MFTSSSGVDVFNIFFDSLYFPSFYPANQSLSLELLILFGLLLLLV